MKYQSVTSHFQNGGGRDRPVFEEKTRTGENLGRRRPTAAGIDWVHEIKHDGYRIIVRRDGPTVRLYSRNAYDWTVRLAAIAAAAELIKAKSFTIDGEAVVLRPDGLSQFEELSRREAARTAILYAFDLIEHDGEDLGGCPFLDRKAALAWLTSPRTALVFAHACRLGAGASRRRRSMARINPARATSGSRSAIPPASPYSGSGARGGIGDYSPMPVHSRISGIHGRSRPIECLIGLAHLPGAVVT
jgi:hypothetical protein